MASEVNTDLFRGQFKKTRMCSFFEKNRCRAGDSCAFAHSIHDLSGAPDLKKTSLCHAWKAGHCPHTASACMFAHGAGDLRSSPAYAWKSGRRQDAMGVQRQRRGTSHGSNPSAVGGIDLSGHNGNQYLDSISSGRSTTASDEDVPFKIHVGANPIPTIQGSVLHAIASTPFPDPSRESYQQPYAGYGGDSLKSGHDWLEHGAMAKHGLSSLEPMTLPLPSEFSGFAVAEKAVESTSCWRPEMGSFTQQLEKVLNQNVIEG